MREPIRTGLVGYGFAGRLIHAPAITAAPGLELRAVATRQREQLHADLPRADATGYEQMLADPAIELVVLAVPNEQHFPLTRQALETGKHVVLDKPFAETWEQAAELARLADEAGLTLSVFHNRRWDGDFRLLRRVVAEGLVGRPVLLESRFDRFRPEPRDRWRERPGIGAGLWYDLGPHLVDQAFCLFGLPESLTAHISTLRDGAHVDDDFLVVLHYPRLQAVLRASMLMASPTPRFVLLGDSGTFTKPWFDPLAASRSEPTPGLLATGDGALRSISPERGDASDYYAELAAAIREGGPNPVSATEALAVMAVLELARESAAEGRTLPVRGDRRIDSPAWAPDDSAINP